MRRDPVTTKPVTTKAIRAKAITTKPWRHIALHTVAAASFIFVLQRFALHASLPSSLLWALTLGGCAAGLAYSQSNR
ncbi:hypothetical protein [Bradyrhizobium sp.]|uniref:hypothetical protein n=1 Tax=Bradyrhizobium sp. TaxID=376 RepID=UPI003C63C013